MSEELEAGFEGDPDGAGPLPRGKYYIRGKKALVFICALSFLLGFLSGWFSSGL